VPELASFSNKARLLGRGIGLDKHRRTNPIWAPQIKVQLGKLALNLPLADVLRDQQQQNGLVLEAVTLEDIPRPFGACRTSPRPVRPPCIYDRRRHLSFSVIVQ